MPSCGARVVVPDLEKETLPLYPDMGTIILVMLVSMYKTESNLLESKIEFESEFIFCGLNLIMISRDVSFGFTIKTSKFSIEKQSDSICAAKTKAASLKVLKKWNL